MEVAHHEHSKFVIERILAHRGDKPKRSTLEFLVKLEDFDESDNIWEPLSNVRLKTHLHMSIWRTTRCEV